ncbi:557_t:CDS:2, partial [Funneliformis mosseae]
KYNRNGRIIQHFTSNNNYVFQVEAYKNENDNDNDNKKFFKINDERIPFEEFKVGQLESLISLDIDESALNPKSNEADIETLEAKDGPVDHKDLTLYINPIEKMYFKLNVDEYKLLAQVSNTWCIIDRREPQISHDYNGGKFIMVSSPQKETIKSFVKAQKCIKMYMPTWEKDEILECFDFLDADKNIVMEGKSSQDITQLGGLRGTLFEMIAHTRIRQGGKFQVRELTKEGNGSEYTRNFKFLEEKFFDDVNEIQHSMEQEGLRAIYPILEEGEVRIYFVLPKNIFANFKKKQNYENKGEGNVFVQYALCVNLEY